MQKQVAGTEDGIKEPQATFSACFGAAFIMMHPTRYAAMLSEKMQKHGATGWLVNTGWSAGRYEINRNRNILMHLMMLFDFFLSIGEVGFKLGTSFNVGMRNTTRLRASWMDFDYPTFSFSAGMEQVTVSN